MKKVEAIQDWPGPLTKNQVCTFVGLTSYYRRFIPHFASLASPLTDLTRDCLGREPPKSPGPRRRRKPFRTLRECCVQELVTSDFAKPMVVQMDAS